MLFIIGFVVVVSCVIGAYAVHGGHIPVLWQPSEFVIILGAATGALIISSPMHLLKGLGGGMGLLVKGSPYMKTEPYLQIMGFFYELSKLMRAKGIKEVEQQIDHPHESALFQKYPAISKDHHLEAFICDNVRLIVMGAASPNQLEELMDQELFIHHQERHAISNALINMADGMPALGIVAAVLGVIHTMGSITEPPEVLGHLIGAALVGTFCGVLFSYGFVGPMGKNLEAAYNAEGAYYGCVKTAILNFSRQVSPQMIAEFVRKQMPGNVRPSFNQAEEYINGIGK